MKLEKLNFKTAVRDSAKTIGVNRKSGVISISRSFVEETAKEFDIFENKDESGDYYLLPKNKDGDIKLRQTVNGGYIFNSKNLSRILFKDIPEEKIYISIPLGEAEYVEGVKMYPLITRLAK